MLNHLYSLLRERDTKLRKTFALVNNFSPANLKTAFVNVLINVKFGFFFFLFFFNSEVSVKQRLITTP